MWQSYLSESSRPGSTPSPSGAGPSPYPSQGPGAGSGSDGATDAPVGAPVGQQHHSQQRSYVDEAQQQMLASVSATSASASLASSADLGASCSELDMSAAAIAGSIGGLPPSAPGGPAAGGPTDEDELTIPRAAMNKMLKELLPSVRIANESRELVLNCCSEFIHHIATQANEVCNQHHKKTINAEHILTALDQLGFSEYREDAQRVFADCKEVAAKRRKQSSRLEHLGVPEEELFRQQQELFAKARQEQAEQAQQEWAHIQQAAMAGLPMAPESDDDDEY